VTVANGVDNLGVYIPIFANDRPAIAVYAPVFALLTGVWCIVGYFIARNPWSARFLRNAAGLLLPTVLIVVGLHILWGLT